MKKYLASLILLVSVLFIGSNKVKALTVNDMTFIKKFYNNNMYYYEPTDTFYFPPYNEETYLNIKLDNASEWPYIWGNNGQIIFSKSPLSFTCEDYNSTSKRIYAISEYSQKALSLSYYPKNSQWQISAASNNWVINGSTCNEALNRFASSNWPFHNFDYIYNGQVFSSSNIDFSLAIKEPQNITFTSTNETSTDWHDQSYISMVNLNVNFDIFDTTNFKYQWTLDDPNNTWEDFQINDYTINIDYNTTVYVRVLDNNDEYILGSTFTIANIDDSPRIDYKIEEGTEQGKKLTVRFKNFKNSDYIVVHNFQTGEENNYDMRGTLVYDNLNIDTSFQFDTYNRDNEFIKTVNIDISLGEININKDRYIQVHYNSTRRIYLANFWNTRTNDKCYYKYEDSERTEIPCNNSFTIEKRDTEANDYFELFIFDKNDNLKVKKIINYQFNDNAPKFSFESYYNSEESKQVLKVIIDNLNNGDYIYYSIDNKETWLEINNQRITELDFYTDTEVYFKVERNGNVISRSYFNVIFKAYENSEKDNKEVNGFTAFIVYFTRIFSNIRFAPLDYGKSVYNSIANSKLGFYLIFIIASSILIAIIKASRR